MVWRGGTVNVSGVRCSFKRWWIIWRVGREVLRLRRRRGENLVPSGRLRVELVRVLVGGPEAAKGGAPENVVDKVNAVRRAKELVAVREVEEVYVKTLERRAALAARAAHVRWHAQKPPLAEHVDHPLPAGGRLEELCGHF